MNIFGGYTYYNRKLFKHDKNTQDYHFLDAIYVIIFYVIFLDASIKNNK